MQECSPSDIFVLDYETVSIAVAEAKVLDSLLDIGCDSHGDSCQTSVAVAKCFVIIKYIEHTIANESRIARSLRSL